MFKKLLKSKTSIKPTWRLWLSLLMIVIAMFASINYQKSILHWLAYTLLFICSISITYNLFMISAVNAIWKHKNRIFQNETLNLELQILDAPTPFGWLIMDNKPLNKNITLPVGIHCLSNIKLYTEYPFGFFKTCISLPDIENICIYPCAIDHKNKLNDSSNTVATDVFRPFRHGDSPRRILKKTMALPQNKWQSKRDSTESNSQVGTELNWYKLDTTLTPKEKLEQLSYYINGMPDKNIFSIILPTKRIQSGYGKTHKHHALKALAETWQLLKIS